MQIRYIACLLLLNFSFSCNEKKNIALPIYNPVDLNPNLVDKSLLNKTTNHRVSDFSLINQNGEIITHDNYKNKIYVTDFFFTRCGSICPIMTNNMKDIQSYFLNDPDVMFLSISVTPKIDSIPILKEYATSKGVIDGKWHVATGNKKHIYQLARKSYFAAVEQGDGGLQDFIHTPNFILIDKKRQIRGIYDGTNTAEIERIIEDIKILQN